MLILSSLGVGAAVDCGLTKKQLAFYRKWCVFLSVHELPAQQIWITIAVCCCTHIAWVVYLDQGKCLV